MNKSNLTQSQKNQGILRCITLVENVLHPVTIRASGTDGRPSMLISAIFIYLYVYVGSLRAVAERSVSSKLWPRNL